MVTRRKWLTHWTEVKRVVVGPDGEPTVKQTTCCCRVPGGRRGECAAVGHLKNPCRCFCHSKKLA